MFSGPYSIAASSGRDLEEFARELGVELEPIARLVGLDVGIFQKIHERISLNAFTRLLDILKSATSDDCIGIRYGEHYRIGNSGPFGFALLHAPTFRDALSIYRDYQQLIADFAFFDVDIGDKETSIEWRYASIIDHPEQYVDMRARLACRFLQKYMGDKWFPGEVKLVREAPRSVALHRKLLGPSVVFGSVMNCITFTSAFLDTATAGADPRLFELMVAACQTELEKLRQKKDLRVQIKEQILAVLPVRTATLSHIASRLAMGERSLQRKLALMGTSFEKLLDDTRRQLSDRLLFGTDTPIVEIGYLCGYSNTSAYSRAAKGWYGLSPAQARRKRTSPNQLPSTATN